MSVVCDWESQAIQRVTSVMLSAILVGVWAFSARRMSKRIACFAVFRSGVVFRLQERDALQVTSTLTVITCHGWTTRHPWVYWASWSGMFTPAS